MNVCFVGPPASQGGRWRAIWPAEAVAAGGHRAVVSRVWPASAGWDAIVIHRPVETGDLYWIKVHRRWGARVLLTVDDDLEHIPSWNSSAEGYNAERLGRFRRALRLADGVIVTTDELVRLHARRCRRIALIPNLIPARYIRRWPRPSDPKLRIGWTGSVFVHKGDLQWIAPEGRRMFSGGITFTTVGDRRTSGYIGAQVVEAFPWSNEPSGRDFYRLMARADIGIVPLSDDRFNLSKSAIKALEYHILGVPVVVRDLPEQRAYVRDGVDGFVRADPRSFADAVRELVNDPNLRSTMGAAGKERAREWTIEAKGDLWTRALGSLRDEVWSKAHAAPAEGHLGEPRTPSDRRSRRASTGDAEKAGVV